MNLCLISSCGWLFPHQLKKKLRISFSAEQGTEDINVVNINIISLLQTVLT